MNGHQRLYNKATATNIFGNQRGADTNNANAKALLLRYGIWAETDQLLKIWDPPLRLAWPFVVSREFCIIYSFAEIFRNRRHRSQHLLHSSAFDLDGISRLAIAGRG